jgi:F-type H+-transporting ATPase subunit delta
MLATIVAERYARAFLQAAEDASVLDQVALEAQALAQALQDDEARSFLASPVTAAEKKLEILAGSFPDGLSALSKSFLKMVLQNKRGMFLTRILDTFMELLVEKRGQVKGKVTSAVALTENQQRLLEVELSGRFGRQVSLTPLVDKKLLGGLKLEMGDTVYDGTLRASLRRLGEKLKQEPPRRKKAAAQAAAPKKKTAKKKKVQTKKSSIVKKPAKKAVKKKR